MSTKNKNGKYNDTITFRPIEKPRDFYDEVCESISQKTKKKYSRSKLINELLSEYLRHIYIKYGGTDAELFELQKKFRASQKLN